MTLSYNEITLRKYIVLDGIPYEVIDSHVSRKQKRKPINQTKLKNLITGKVSEKAFHASDTVEEASMEIQQITYLFNKPSRKSGVLEYWFNKKDDPKDRFILDENIVSKKIDYLRSNDSVDALIFDDKVIGLKIPIKVTIRVTEAPPAVRGNTAQGGTKSVTLETGLKVTTPLFINEGDSIVINTETSQYVERA